MRTLFMHRVVAEDLVDYWAEVDVHDNSSVFSRAHPITGAAVRSACSELERALNRQPRAILHIDLEEPAAQALFREAVNRHSIMSKEFELLHVHLEASQSRRAWELVRGYKRLLRQR